MLIYAKLQKFRTKFYILGIVNRVYPLLFLCSTKQPQQQLRIIFQRGKKEPIFWGYSTHRWIISNSKNQFSSHRLGHAVRKDDKKPEFLRAFSKWIEEWHGEKNACCQTFTLSTQTASALIRTLRSHASLYEDLLNEGYDYVLTARLQSDPLERRFGQYRHMSGGRFLVSLKDTCSEKILKLKRLLKEVSISTRMWRKINREVRQ